jgi:hypothetical protein
LRPILSPRSFFPPFVSIASTDPPYAACFRQFLHVLVGKDEGIGRGKMRIRDREGLLNSTCECYANINNPSRRITETCEFNR